MLDSLTLANNVNDGGGEARTIVSHNHELRSDVEVWKRCSEWMKKRGNLVPNGLEAAAAGGRHVSRTRLAAVRASNSQIPRIATGKEEHIIWKGCSREAMYGRNRCVPVTAIAMVFSSAFGLHPHPHVTGHGEVST